MKLKPVLLAVASLSAALTLLTACGGGGGASGISPSANTLTGTAATGAPIAGTVVAIDANGKSSPPATTSATGAFTVDVAGLTAPFILSITGTSAGKQVFLNSIATAVGQTVNITPLTDLIVSTAAGVPAGGTLADLCTPVSGSVAAGCRSALTAATAGTKLADAVRTVSDMIAPLNTGGTNPLTGAFAANGTGFDAVLDKLLVTPADPSSLMATVTLIGTNKQIGQVVLPAKPGDLVVPTVTAPSTTEVDKATTMASIVPEVKACLASLSALYPKTGFTAPTADKVSPFIASSYRRGRSDDKAAFVSAMTSGQDVFVGGFTLSTDGLAKVDMSPFSASEISALAASTAAQPFQSVMQARPNSVSPVTLDEAGKPVSAWVRLSVNGQSQEIWKVVKGAAYSGCAGGWQLAGSQRMDMHMQARITRNADSGGNVTIARYLPLHTEVSKVLDEVATSTGKIDTLIVGGPGLALYSGNSASPVGASTKVRLTIPSDPLQTSMQIADGKGYYGVGEALQSCQDLASTSAAAGTPCFDETQVAPGAVYGWVFKTGGANGTIVTAFPHQILAVPLSKTFTTANQNNLFATLTSTTPSTIAAIKLAISSFANGTLDNFFTFNYTQGSAYGSRADNCRISLYDGTGTSVLIAEQNAVSKESSCTFNSDNLNSGNLSKPTASSVSSGYVSVATSVLGNQAVSGRPIAP